MRYRPDGSDCLLSFNTCKIEWPCSEENSWKEFALLKERLGNFLFIWLKNLLLTTSKCLFWVTEGLTKSIDLICQSRHLLLQNLRPVLGAGLVCLKCPK